MMYHREPTFIAKSQFNLKTNFEKYIEKKIINRNLIAKNNIPEKINGFAPATKKSRSNFKTNKKLAANKTFLKGSIFFVNFPLSHRVNEERRIATANPKTKAVIDCINAILNLF